MFGKKNWRGTQGKCKRCGTWYVRQSGFKKYCSKGCRSPGSKEGQIENVAKKSTVVVRRKTETFIKVAQPKKIARPNIRPMSEREKQYANHQAFYLTPAWRMLRYEAFIKYGRRCMCCGAMPPKVILHVDHVKPRSRYPELELDIRNLQILCEACNMGKGGRHETDFRV